MTFNSTIDWWVGLSLASPPVVTLSLIILGAFYGQTEMLYWGIGTFTFVAILYWALVWPVKYALEPRELVVSFGVCRVRVSYQDIESLEPSRNPISAPAFSHRRLKIRRKKGFAILISPAQRTQFLRQLAEMCPHLRLDGEALRPNA